MTAHADCGAAAAVNRHARATRALTHTRTAGALRLDRRRRAAGHILFRSGAALALPAAALLAHAGATLLAAGTTLLSRAGAGTRLHAGILRLRAGDGFPNQPPLGRRQRELPRPRTSLRVFAFFSPEEGLPARQSGRGRWVSARSKNYG